MMPTENKRPEPWVEMVTEDEQKEPSVMGVISVF